MCVEEESKKGFRVAPVKNAKFSGVVWLASLSGLSRNENVRASLPSLVWLVFNSSFPSFA